MKANAVIRLKFPSETHLKTILRALEPESRKSPTMRSRVFLEKEGVFLVLRVEAEDTVALRASINAYLRWINSSMNVLEVLKKL